MENAIIASAEAVVGWGRGDVKRDYSGDGIILEMANWAARVLRDWQDLES